MVNDQENGLVVYGLVLSFPLRMALFAVYVYLENLLALMQLIQEALGLQLLFVSLVMKWVYQPRPENGAAPSLRHRTLKGLEILLASWTTMLHGTAQTLRIPCYGIMQLSRLFRICANSRTWTIMMQPHTGAQR
ncbi:uncharacterized protein LOC6553551 [Drosophila erecta]|uniref:GG19747 n=1 Tax=Drosophila erecta TaxID=7220 RepID=B3P436_DROER|nr:uncharacterized protein LOC6553551 [Drosophila erecta]EDV49210.1 uncharacterized protein Dere_GG19747 [Drosophila erecta]